MHKDEYKILDYLKSLTPIVIFISAVLFSLCVWFFLFSMRPPTTWEYSDIAKNLIKNHSFSYKHLNIEYMCFCPPLYTFLVAFVYFFSNFNSLAVIFMQIIIFSLLCAVVFITGKKIFGFKAGFLASI